MKPTERSAASTSWRTWHRFISVTVALPLGFYAVTGIALNHRKVFEYFQVRRSETRDVRPRAVEPLREFLAFYKAQIGREDDPAVIRIKGERSVEFLYGSHGETTYSIDPVAGRLTQTTKTAREPWATLNRLHKAFNTPAVWAWASDGLSVVLLGSIATGLCIPGTWKRCWRTLLVSGMAFVALLGFLSR